MTPEFAADGVDEVASIFHPRQVRLGRTTPLDAAVRLVAEDTGDVWVLGDADSDPAASLTARARDLYLGLWGRLDLLDVPTARVDGDRGAVQTALGSSLVP